MQFLLDDQACCITRLIGFLQFRLGRLLDFFQRELRTARFFVRSSLRNGQRLDLCFELRDFVFLLRDSLFQRSRQLKGISDD
jgi:hypothetical protein